MSDNVYSSAVEQENEIHALKAEIDRLTYELHRFESCYITLDETLKAKTREDELERLRDQVTRLSTLVDTERSLHDTEIERLRELVTLREKQLDTHINALFKKDAEIERLRKENSELLGDRLLGKSRLMQKDLKECREEIELLSRRLRVREDEIFELRAENAELRKLISEAIDKPFTFGRQSTIDAWQVQWSMRVKQLLNERI